MNWTVIDPSFSGFVGGVAVGIFFTLILILLVLVLLAVYVYFAMAWMTIARKLKYKKAWLAWVPFANVAMILQLGGIYWGWVFLFLVPILGWIALFIMTLVASWTIIEKRNYPGWLSLFQLIPIAYLVVIGFVAWSEQKKK